MPKHPRQIIREKVAAALKFQTAAQDRVFETRMVPWKTTELPGIAIYANSEGAEQASLYGDLDRALTLWVVGVVSASGNVDDALDALTLEIEAALHADQSLGGSAMSSGLTGTEFEMADEGGRLVGVARLTYDVRYQTAAPE